MHRVLVLGAGKIGSLLSGLLASSGDYEISLADANGKAAESVAASHKQARIAIKAYQVDASNKAALETHLKAHPADAVISSLPYFCNPPVAEV
ncbi:MAG TPA: saccharopine dehydrogenase NADP-binding domain-containing protein, partial [Gammaproteobacteria bacterium]|nr:saccharopine dehydrogenase NADP-binding domain-containing protein [Gammaproteobacteria bacterium]